MDHLAIIPARSGSKGLKDKNIRLLAGKPLLAYSIDAAIRSGEFSEVMVSTDSPEYAEIAKQYGAKVPFLRSREASSDEAGSQALIREVLEGYRRAGRRFDTFCLLQPTSPLRNAEDIRGAYSLYREKKAIAVVSVCEMEHPSTWCGALDDTWSLDGFIPRSSADRRQDVRKSYRLNGAIYIADIGEYCRDSFFYRAGSYAYLMSGERSVDIDTAFDFQFAEFLLDLRGGAAEHA